MWIVFALVITSSVLAQEVRRIDFSRQDARRVRVRIDAGIGLGGCQGSYFREVDWTQVINSAHKPERASYWPALYAELEIRPAARLGFVAHYDVWGNGRSIEAGNRGYNYYSHAQTFLAGGRWYYDWNTPRIEWYSGLMAGWSHNWSTGAAGVPKVDTSDFAHQLTFIGFRKKGPLGVSIELGQGYKGFLVLGVSAAF